MADGVLGASFRDPSGFVFEQEGVLYRQVDRRYAPHYDQLMESGLYAELIRLGLLIPHEEVTGVATPGDEAYRVLRPERVPFVSYPYEWCFGQLRDAGLLTLRVQETALRFGMTLKDASAYNVQFRAGRPVFIDTLSFERLEEGRPWVGYRQFCEHFLAPLALVAHRDVRLTRLLRANLDGIPLDLARGLMPQRAWLSPHLFLHLRLHARYQRRFEGDETALASARPVRRGALENLVTALRTALRRLDWAPRGTAWADYEPTGSYDEAGLEQKRALVDGHLEKVRPAEVWDLGANTGGFSRLASQRGIRTLAFDVDPACVEKNYRQVRSQRETHLLPLVLDLADPSPALGFGLTERFSLLERRSAELVMALALVHHLALRHNVPLPRLAAFLAQLAPHLVIEFVPKGDARVRTLLANREDVFPDYSVAGFESAFGAHFRLEEATPLEGSERILYRMRRRSG